MFQIYTYTILIVYTIQKIDILGLYRCLWYQNMKTSTRKKKPCIEFLD